MKKLNEYLNKNFAQLKPVWAEEDEESPASWGDVIQALAGLEVVSDAKRKQLKEEKLYSPYRYISEKEIADFIGGQDLWLSADDMYLVVKHC